MHHFIPSSSREWEGNGGMEPWSGLEVARICFQNKAQRAKTNNISRLWALCSAIWGRCFISWLFVSGFCLPAQHRVRFWTHTVYLVRYSEDGTLFQGVSAPCLCQRHSRLPAWETSLPCLLHRCACANRSPGNWLKKGTDVQCLAQRTRNREPSSAWILIFLCSFKKSFPWVSGGQLSGSVTLA